MICSQNEKHFSIFLALAAIVCTKVYKNQDRQFFINIFEVKLSEGF